MLNEEIIMGTSVMTSRVLRNKKKRFLKPQRLIHLSLEEEQRRAECSWQEFAAAADAAAAAVAAAAVAAVCDWCVVTACRSFEPLESVYKRKALDRSLTTRSTGAHSGI